ncbi:MAG: bifunctional oligoribonuclease/PAP phosphatase NrnA [Lachnospiraceae bacterium]|nr:bifunctional oligoribonuclease/PAP phosphatase NrnA [Lachnospiraceae bacterium]
MNEEIKKTILNKIKEYDKIIISRHFRPDGDAVGSTLGLQRILKASFPEKTILCVNEDYSDYVAFLGEEDTATDEDYKDALMIVVDTATEDRCSNKKVNLGKELIKIDHHVDIAPYGDISWVEDWRSSACEMIVDFYVTFKDELTITKEAALALYTGMVTDSGRFKYTETCGETLRMAAVLLDVGVDIVTLYARLYLEDFDYLKFQSYVYDHMKVSENGVAYVYVDKEMQEKFNLSHEQASNVVSMLSEIKGCIVWLAFIDNPDGTIRVRLRSRFVVVNKLAEKYGGGGHLCACGANVNSTEEMEALVKDADALVKDFKANNFYL